MIGLLRRLVVALETIAQEQRMLTWIAERNAILQERMAMQVAEMNEQTEASRKKSDEVATLHRESAARYREYLDRQQIAESLEANILQ